ncbi:UNVERIFIED_CONTAM: hypothetical protein PYX00_004319 [Menopon gallinae]|uniref:Dopamine N-acetyltransferase n=1 Tax=Menopon gallinae TaxID=328185 RepID=A0AAW2I3P8_9NEOP
MPEKFRVVRMTKEHIPGAIIVLREAFFTTEKVSTCVRILDDSEEIPNDTGYKLTVAAKELEDLAIDAIKDGVSFAAVDVVTNEVYGVALNKIQKKPPPGKLSYFEQFAKDNIKEKPSLELVDFMVRVDGMYDLFGNYNTDCLLEIMFLAVRTDKKGMGIGTALVTNSVNLGQKLKLKNEKKDPSIDVKSEAKEYQDSEALDAVPKCVTAIFTSRFSQLCGRRSGFEEVLKVPYTEFNYKGKSYADTIGPDHPYCTLSVKTLQ